MEATRGGALPVVMDAASCTHGMIDIAEGIGIEVIDAVTFVAENMLDHLPEANKVGSITLHPTCSTTHLGIQDDLEKVAGAAAEQVHVPANWGCCGYAGDRGMLHPELTDSATKQEATEVHRLGDEVHASCNRTCELGLTRATGQDYHHVLEVLEATTR